MKRSGIERHGGEEEKAGSEMKQIFQGKPGDF